MQKITPFLWFNNQAEEAVNLYTSIFANSKMESMNRYPDGPLEGPMQGMEGKVLTTVFELEGQRFMALDGGPNFQFTPAISFSINCETEQEIQYLWEKLSEGGEALMPLQAYDFSPMFGWLKDKFGVSWQLNLGARSQKITPLLMFVGDQHANAEKALNFYMSLFDNSSVEHIERYAEGEMGGERGTIKQSFFTLHGQAFIAMDSNFAHNFTFTGAISFHVNCDSQAEVDHFWYKLSADPNEEQCGWLRDQYGISWQIIPSALGKLMGDPDTEKSKRVMDAMLQMKKIDVAGLEAAYAG